MKRFLPATVMGAIGAFMLAGLATVAAPSSAEAQFRAGGPGGPRVGRTGGPRVGVVRQRRVVGGRPGRISGRNAAIGAGVIGALAAGALIAGAARAQPAPVYEEGYDEPRCYWTRQRRVNDWGEVVVRRVRVCD